MATLQKHIHIQQSPSPSPSSSSSLSNNGSFPILAIAVLCITATAFLLISYYILATKCCFTWQQFDLLRRFSFRRPPSANDHPLTTTTSSPSWQSRGLEELLIRNIPTLHYTKDSQNKILSKCVVCLNEFQENDILKLLPKCNHVFHLDCVDIWLLRNANCPICRSAISGRNRYKLEKITAPNCSPEDPRPVSIAGSDEDFVVIELSGQLRRSEKSKQRKCHHVSIMGDEGIDVREKDDQFVVEPIRRSFSMDSAADRNVYLSVQEIVQRNEGLFGGGDREESSSRGCKSIFSFGHGRGSRNSVLPL